MLKTSTLNEQVHYSKEFWRQFGIDLVSGDYSSIQTRHLDSITLKVIKEQLEADPDYDSLVAISQHIRASFLDQQEKDERYREYLGLLYWLAAVSSFFFNKNKQYVKPLNKLNPPKTSLLTLPFSYHDLGYKELILLEKKDMDAFIKTWGRPRNHKTLRGNSSQLLACLLRRECRIQSANPSRLTYPGLKPWAFMRSPFRGDRQQPDTSIFLNIQTEHSQEFWSV